MIDVIWRTLSNTPWWVYLLLIVLLKLGIEASKPQVVPIRRMVILPAVFIWMSTHTLLTAVNPNAFTISTWLISIVMGAVVGWWQVQNFRLRVDKSNGLLELPGTWTTLIFIIIIFGTKYYFGYELSIDPYRHTDTWFEFSMLAVSGLCTGFFIGRLICYVKRLYNDPQTDLSEFRGN